MERCSPAHRPPLFPSSASAVARGLERRELEGLRHLGLEEKSFRRGQDYISVLTEVGAELRVLEVCGGGAFDRHAARGGAGESGGRGHGQECG